MTTLSISGRTFWHTWRRTLVPLALLLLVAATSFVVKAAPLEQADPEDAEFLFSGQLLDTQGQPVDAASIHVGEAETESQEDGSWSLALAEMPASGEDLVIERPHFSSQTIAIDANIRQALEERGSYNTGPLTLERRITIGFWVATISFVLVLLLIALEKLHSTTAALLGMSLVFISTFIGQAINEDWYIFNFERGIEYINWEVIFLVMAMMIVIAIIEETGIFQWTAFQAYRLSGGKHITPVFEG